MTEYEQMLVEMLHTLPIAITIRAHEQGYVWTCYERSGLASSVLDALKAALTYLEGLV